MSTRRGLEVHYPDLWKVLALGRVARIGTGSADTQDSEEDGAFPFYVRSPHIERLNSYTHDTDAVLTAGDGDVGEVFHIARGKFAAHQRVYIIEPTGRLELRFLHYVMSSRFKESLGGQTAKSTVESLRRPMLTQFKFGLPPRSQQSFIADYLDHETAEIDALISDQQDALNLLSSRWESELVRCVQTGVHTGTHATGLDTWQNAPQAWRKTRLKATIISARNGAWGTEPNTDETTVRCIRVADFDKIHGSVHDKNATARSYPNAVVVESSLQPGDLILEKSGGGPTTPVGNVVRYTGPGGEMYSNFVARIKVAHGVDSAYALRLHQALYASGITIRSIKQTTGIQNLDSTSYFNEPIFLPPKAEQQRIAEHLEGRRRVIDELGADLTRAIALAKERRAALITVAVTGQIDVTATRRPAAEQLEDDIKELT